MKVREKYSALFFSISITLILIIDGKTALSGAAEGIQLCIGSVIPSLFPFITFSYILNSALTNVSYKSIGRFFRLCGIPEGGESLLILGLLGGYPVGAQAINDAYKNNRITISQGRRLLGFCNNAGPAFIFGMASSLFRNIRTLWALWGIHILSAITVSFLIPRQKEDTIHIPPAKIVTLPNALHKGIKTIATICGWVVLFRTLMALLVKYLYPYVPESFQFLTSGGIELTNGFYALLNQPDMYIRFILASCFLGFGGICVMLQTASVTSDVGLGYYFPGKVAQCAISYFLSLIIGKLLFKSNAVPLSNSALFLLLLIISVIFLRKNSSFMENNAV